eukprot:CFRG2320T1
MCVVGWESGGIRDEVLIGMSGCLNHMRRTPGREAKLGDGQNWVGIGQSGGRAGRQAVKERGEEGGEVRSRAKNIQNFVRGAKVHGDTKL